MPKNDPTLPKYFDKAKDFIKEFEGFAEEKTKGDGIAYAYYDSEGIPTIGYGFNLTESLICDLLERQLQYGGKNDEKLEWKQYIKQIRDLKFEKPQSDKYILRQSGVLKNTKKWREILEKLGIAHKEKADVDLPLLITLSKDQLLEKGEVLNSILQTYFPFTLTKENAEKVLKGLIEEKISFINSSNNAREQTISFFFNSYEGIALLSLYYNNPSLIGEGFKRAYEKKNRFKMWFEIRYNSNKGKNIGIAKRRFAESNVFGLFENTKRGEYSNTANWEESEASLKETIKFFSFLHSRFEKEGCNTYFEYIKHYEKDKFFGETTIPRRLEWERDKKVSDLQCHFRPHTEVFFPFVEAFNEAMKNAGCQYDFTLEEILVINQDNRTSIAKAINEKSQDKELAIILEKEIDIGFYSEIKNLKKLHIILAYDNHIDCLGFERASNIVFYVFREEKITKLCGSKEALESKEISFQDATLKGLMQINQDEEIIYCFKEKSDGKFSPNLSIYDKDTFELLATIYNLRSEGGNNA